MLGIMRSWSKAKEEFNGEKDKYVEVDPEFHTNARLDTEDGLLKLNMCVLSPCLLLYYNGFRMSYV
jgi:hypothetical protein